MSRGAALAIALSTAAIGPAVGPASAETIKDEKHRYRLELPSGFAAVSRTAEGTVASYRDNKRGIRLSIARVSYPNRAAWRKKKAFFESVEAGVKDAVTDYKRLSRKRLKLGRVPAMDLWLSREAEDDTDIAAVRFVFFRTYTVVLSVAMTREAYQAHRRRVEAMLTSFEPYFGD